jgi:hypothetical protein
MRPVAEPVTVTLWIEDAPEVVTDDMYAAVIEQHLGVTVTDWTVDRD